MTFADRMNDVLNKLDDAHIADVLALRARLAVAQRIVDAIPSCYPDGTAILSPEQWLAWALPKLGYTHGVLGTFNEQEKELGACSISRATIGDRTHDRRTEEGDRSPGEEEQRGGQAGRCDAVRAGGAELGARGDNAAQHEVSEVGGTGNGAALGVAPTAAAHAYRLEFRPAAEAPIWPAADNFQQAVLYNQCDGFHLAFARFDSDGAFDGFYDWCGTDAYEPDKHFCAWALLPDSALLFEPFARKAPYVADGAEVDVTRAGLDDATFHAQGRTSGVGVVRHETFSPADADEPSLEDINAARDLLRLGPLPGGANG